MDRLQEQLKEYCQAVTQWNSQFQQVVNEPETTPHERHLASFLSDKVNALTDLENQLRDLDAHGFEIEDEQAESSSSLQDTAASSGVPEVLRHLEEAVKRRTLIRQATRKLDKLDVLERDDPDWQALYDDLLQYDAEILTAAHEEIFGPELED